MLFKKLIDLIRDLTCWPNPITVSNLIPQKSKVKTQQTYASLPGLFLLVKVLEEAHRKARKQPILATYSSQMA